MSRMGGFAVGALVACALVAPAAAKEKGKGKAKPPDPAKAVKALVKLQVQAMAEESPYEAAPDTPWYLDESAFFADAAEEGALGAVSSAVSQPPLGLVGGKSNSVKGLKVVVSADKESAWVTFLAQGPGHCIHDDCYDPDVYRATELFVKVGGEWKILAGMWSMGMPDDLANEMAMDGSAPAPAALADDEDEGEGPAELLDAVVAPLRKGAAFADVISTRADFELFGSAPKERIAGGEAFRKAWKAWGPNVTVEGKVRAGLAPSGTVGWVAANLRLAKSAKAAKGGKEQKGYAIFFRAFFVCEKDKKNGWRVVGAHLAVPRSTDGG